jgi:lipopolysaccharide export system permease protein
VLNTITEQFVMKVARSDAGTGKIWDIVIYDLSKPLERKTIYADSGRISLAPNEKDLQLELFDGHVQELVKGNGRRLQRTFFRTQNVRVSGISQGFERSENDNYKGDREMSICELHTRYKVAGREYSRLRSDYMKFSDKKEVANLVMRNPRTRPEQQAIATVYCNALAAVSSIFRTKTANAAELPDQQSAVAAASQDTVRKDTLRRDSTRRDATQRDSVRVMPPSTVTPVPLQPPPVSPQDSVTTDSIVTQPTPVIPDQTALTTPQSDSVFITSAFMATTTQLVEQRMTLDQVAVEIHKKFALSFACLVFVLFGPPIALRFPRGGVGVTIGVSIVVFGAYYVCLMGGEALADNGRLPPFIAMWIANVVFGIAGVALLWRVERTTDASRGGGFGDWWAERKAMRALRREERKAARETANATPVGAP